MGLLSKVNKVEIVAKPTVEKVVQLPVIAPAEVMESMPLQQLRYGDLDFIRDSRGLIESISTTDQYGQKVSFVFRRNNMRVLEGISVKSGKHS